MPTASITSTKTGQTFDVDFTNQPTPDDIDEVTSAWETQFYQREGLDPSIAEQGVVGTAGNAFARDLGGTALDAVGGVAKGTAEMSRALGPMGNALRFVPGVSSVMSLGDVGEQVAGFTDAVREESRAVYPVNPANPVAETIGGGAGQAVAMLGTMGAAAPVLGTGAALTVVPSVLGGTMGLGSGIDIAKQLGIDNPAGRLALGAAFGGAEALTERLGGIGGKAAAEALQAGVKAGLKQARKSVLSESIEEPISGTLQDAATYTAGQFVADPNRPGYTVTGMKLPALDAEFMNRRKLEAIGGAAGGAVFGGLQLAASGRDSETGRGGDLDKGRPSAMPPPVPVSEDLGELTAEDVADLEPEGVGQPVSQAGQVAPRRAPILGDVPDGGRRMQGFQDDPLGATAPGGGGNVLRDFGIAKSPNAQAIADAAEVERQRQVAAMQVQNGPRSMPRIPDSPLGALDILDYLNETPLKVARKGSEAAGNAENDWSERFNVPMYYRKFIASSERGYEPSTIAQQFYEQGLINEPTVDALMAEVESTINARTQYRVQFRQQAKALEQEAKQVSSFEKDQAKAGDRDKTLVALDDVAAGDEMLINGEKAVVRKIDYDEDGYLTNVVIEDGKRYGVLSLDPTTRAGVFVDEYQPRQREQAAPDFADPFTMQSVSEEELAAEKARAKQRADLAERQSATLKGDAGEYGTPDMLDSTAGDMALFSQAGGATSPDARVPAADESPGLAGVQTPRKTGFKNLEPGGKTAGFVNAQILAEAETLIRDGFTDFANWSRAMVTRFGQAIRQYLQGIWQQVVAALPNDAAKNVRLGRPAGGPVRLSAAGALDVGPTAGKGVLGTVADGQVITAKVPNLEQASHANIREIASAGQEDGAKDFRYNPQTQTVYWGRLSSVSEAERQKVADWLTAEGYKVTGHKATTGNDANYREAHGLPGKPAVKLSQGGFVAGPGKVKETQSRFASPDEQERLYQVREDVTVKAAAEAWVDSMPMEQAVAAMEAGRLPADMTGDVAQHAAGLLIQRTTEMMKSGSEVVQMQARSLGHRISKVWQGWLSQEAGRNLRQRSVVNSELSPYAPILAAEGMLIDRADAVMDQRFDGGAEGGATKVNELVKKVDEQTSAEISQAVEETMVNAPPTDPVVAAAAVKAVTNAARAYFGGSLPPRVKILHQESAEWDARLNGEVLELNAAALETSQVIAKIEHEIGHLLFRDPSMQSYFAELWAGLDVSERAQIENITAALYDAQNRNEEASVRALDSVRQLIEAKNPTLWQRFVSWVQRAWERFTGRLPRDPRRLAAVMIETGVARLRGEAGNQTEVRESRRSSLLKVNSPALVKALNALRGKMYPGVKWADIFMELPASQKERQRAIYTRLQKDAALRGLTQAERLTLTNELNKAWQQERRKVFLRELGRVGIGEKAAADKAKVVKALPKLIRLINLGMMNSDMFREAIAPEYGLKQITTGQALALRKLAEEAYALPEGVLRSRKLAALLDGIQKSTGTGLPEVLNQYWVAAVLSGMRTQFDTFMSVTNGFGNQLIQSGMLAIKNGNRAAAMVSMLEWWRGLKQAFPEAMQILAKGDYSYLKRFNEDLKKALEGESTFRPVPLGEALWRDGNAMEKYGFAPVMIWTGRLMAAADHMNNSATTAGAKVVARALHPELYKTVAASQSERDAAAAQARREVTGGAMPATAQERATVAARTREILNGQLRPEELKEASFMGDQAAYQNDPTGVFGAIYRAVNQGMGSLERGLQTYAEERGAEGPAGQYARGLMLFLSGAMRSMMGAKFIRFGANFGNDMLGYVPGTVLTARALLGKEATASQRQLLMGKNVFGLMAGLTVAAMFLGKDDEEEGWHLEGPWTDLTPEEVEQRRAAGFEPLTFWKRTADKVQRVSYKQWPTAGLLAGVAHMQDRQRFRPQKWAQEGLAGHLLAAASVGAFQVKDVSAMRGLADLLGASKFGTNPEEAFVEKMAKMPINFAGGFIPTLAKDLDALADPRRYKPATVMEEFLRNVPLLRQRVADGRPEINILGLPIEQDRKPWSRAYTNAESGAAHAVLGSLNTRGFTLPTPETNRKVWKSGAWTTIAAMGADAEWRYQKKVGDGYRAWLGSAEGAALLTMPDGLAVQRLINRQTEAIKRQAVAQMVK